VRVVVQHRSRYHYPRPALLGPQLIGLRPADHTSLNGCFRSDALMPASRAMCWMGSVSRTLIESSGSRAWGRAAALWRRDPGSGCR